MKKLLIITQKVDKNDQLLGFFIDWIKEFAKHFSSVELLCLEKGEYSLPQNVHVTSMGKDRGASKVTQLFNFYHAISTLKYDAVFVHMNPIWVVLGGLYWRLAGKKACLWYTSKGVTLKLKVAEMLANVVFTASKESFRIPSRKLIITGHGINTDLFKPTTNNQQPTTDNPTIKILSVGRISPVKNYETLIGSAKILADKGFKFRVSLIGETALNTDKNYELRIKNKINDLGLEEYFKFIGKVNNKDLPGYYQSHDLFIHLSKTGSLDKTLLEAMSCGMKVLSSNDAARGFLPPELLFNENNPKELADKIEKISKNIPDASLRQYVVENHNLDKLISKISELIIHA